mgnify:CR=1 FL=1
MLAKEAGGGVVNGSEKVEFGELDPDAVFFFFCAARFCVRVGVFGVFGVVGLPLDLGVCRWLVENLPMGGV